MWDKGQLANLNDLVAPVAEWRTQVQFAFSINDSGVIFGVGVLANGDERPIVLVPNGDGNELGRDTGEPPLAPHGRSPRPRGVTLLFCGAVTWQRQLRSPRPSLPHPVYCMRQQRDQTGGQKPMDVPAYLHRIAYHGDLTPNAATLRALQLAHLQTIPFENLDIYLRRPILLDEARLFQKIVVQRRGGFCYELNGLFAALLRTLGFPVTYLAARDAHPDGSYGPEYDHLTLLVQTPEDGQTRGMTDWLADVGWGDTFCVPLRLDQCDQVHTEGARAYRLMHTGNAYSLWQRQYSGAWEQHYCFTHEPRQYADFATMCHYHQTSPHSLFTQQRLCTKATPEGRITLDQTRLITTIHGQRQEQTLMDEAAFWALARRHFGIEIRDA